MPINIAITFSSTFISDNPKANKAKPVTYIEILNVSIISLSYSLFSQIAEIINPIPNINNPNSESYSPAIAKKPRKARVAKKPPKIESTLIAKLDLFSFWFWYSLRIAFS